MPEPKQNQILIVDDNETNRYTLARLLKHAGYRVSEAATGEAALKALASEPDLLILDVKLPDMNGMELSRSLRQNPKTQHIPILQVSATFTQRSDKIRGLDAGADAYLPAPVDSDELLAHVRMLLRLKETQEELGKTNRRLRSVLSTIADVFFGADYDGHFLEANPAAEALFNVPASELVGRSLREIFPQMAHTPFISIIEQTARNSGPHHFECEWPLAPGTWWEGHSYPREDRVDFYLRDITERKTAERKLNEAAEQMRRQMEELQAAQSELALARDELKRQNDLLEQRVKERTARLGETISDLETFSYSITHDMRAPLRAMQGFSRLLLESHCSQLDPEGMEFLNRIANSANRLDLLIRDVLRYSNIVRARVKLEPVDLDRLLRDIIGDYPGFQPPNAKVLIPEPLPRVLGNEAFLTQCFSNLLTNAVKFVAPGVTPRVEVTSTRNGKIVRVTIRDNGIGIPPEHQQRLFTLFHRAQNHYPGTGIGLAVVRKAVDRIGGQVGLESELGKGSAFWLELQATP